MSKEQKQKQEQKTQCRCKEPGFPPNLPLAKEVYEGQAKCSKCGGMIYFPYTRDLRPSKEDPVLSMEYHRGMLVMMLRLETALLSVKDKYPKKVKGRK